MAKKAAKYRPNKSPTFASDHPSTKNGHNIHASVAEDFACLLMALGDKQHLEHVHDAANL